MEFIVFDNKAITLDRYTIVLEDGEMYGASLNPYSPQGFGQYCGNAFHLCGWDSKDLDRLKYEIVKAGNIGESVEFRNLPSDVQKFINYVSDNKLDTNTIKFKNELEKFLISLNYQIPNNEDHSCQYTLILNKHNFNLRFEERFAEKENIPYFYIEFIVDRKVVSSKDLFNYNFVELYEPLNKMLGYKLYLPEWMKK